MFKDWIQAQRIGVAAYLLCLPDLPPDREDPSRSIFIPLTQFLNAELTRTSNVSAFCETLPASTLELLLAIPSARLAKPLKRLRRDWSFARSRLFSAEADSKEFAPAQIAHILAHHVLHGAGPLAESLKLALYYSSRQIRFPDTKAFDHDLRLLRIGWLPLSDRLSLIDRILMQFGRSSFSYQIRNALYHQLFAWPLLIPAFGGIQAALGLPVNIEVLYKPLDSIDFRII